ncbi:hypothetical protein PHYSODRAFT_329261 [Phytophthora sojae]|uniref:HTH CENPB-type domain-containing protein n=1 Tax=Phytophthora sojae (strain P6497) TaxID=1094619 RepID=G4ZBS0_PHYSP|nr:hypothetical protein PHYSODRAFT_329261 [Phytophthora sojae]EGZ21274.1 hypothetical protein PHYSODRAFT_329261 [Phytophthora sojae]|eukprot:XP_009523991.1 hypothetical protein PHYSODRAFT_329261 [Phytophthora sojae]
MRRGRRRIHDDGRRRRQYQRQTYTVELKIQVIQHFEASGSMRATLDRFFDGMSEAKRTNKAKLVYKWLGMRCALEERAQIDRLASQFRGRASGMGLTLPSEVEQRIVKWVNDFRCEGLPISALMLKLQALEIAQAAGIPPDHFAASWKWRRGFTRRHRLSFRARTHFGQETPPAAALRAAAFARETGIFFEMLPRTTLAPTGSRTVWVKSCKKDKERITAMVLCDSEGNRYTPFLMLKSKPSKVPEVHAENALLQKVPPGLTWLSQTADAVWIKSLKDRLRAAWVTFLRDQLKLYTASNSTEKFTMSAPQRSTIVKWVVSAWEALSATTISAVFRKCGLTGAGDDPSSYELEDDEEALASINEVTSQLEQLQAFELVVKADIVESAVV